MVKTYCSKSRNKPKIIILDDSKESENRLHSFWNTKTRKSIKEPWFIYKGNLYILKEYGKIRKSNSNTVEGIVEDSRSYTFDESIRRPEENSDLGIYYYGNIKKLYSPPVVPQNAVPVYYKNELMYFQITKDGILITKGYLFAKEDIDEGAGKDYYIEKQNDKWIIWFENKIYCFINGRLLEDCNGLEDPSTISNFQENKIVKKDGKIFVYVHYYSKPIEIPEELFKRMPMKIGKTIIYVPLFTIPVATTLIGGNKND